MATFTKLFMKRGLLIFFLFLSLHFVAQIPAYYNGVNLTLTGIPLKNELSQKIISTHTNQLSYNDLWTVLQQTDLDPTNSSKVLLIYGYNDGDGNASTDRTRIKTNYGGNNGQWNREHTYAKSLGTPDLGTSGPGADAHHIRSCDVQTNNSRGSKKFAAGSGNSGTVGSNWYPGNEWKGDVARMIMYMYLRYSTQCAPNNVGVGTSVAIDPAMIDLFLQWNSEDDVSQYEINRNNILETTQGNRNPFIDNPYLATIIWGGTPATDYWNMNSTEEYSSGKDAFRVYPVPSLDGSVHIYFKEAYDINKIELYHINGMKLYTYNNPSITNNEFTIEKLSKGFYLLKTTIDNKVVAKKIIVN